MKPATRPRRSKRKLDTVPHDSPEARDARLYDIVRAGELAAKALQGRFVGSQGTRKELQRRVTLGQRARNQLVERHLGLVVRLMQKYRISGDMTEDMLQEGAIGLMRAVEKFDSDKGFAFSTYATPWILSAISTWLNRYSQPITLPAGTNSVMRAVEAATVTIRQAQTEPPSLAMLANEVGLSVDRLKSLVTATAPVQPLDSLYDDGGVRRSVPSAVEVEAAALQHCCVWRKYLQVLDSREYYVFVRRLSLFEDRRHSFEELALALDISKEAARLAFKRACAKLAHPSVAFELYDTLVETSATPN